MFCPNCGEDLKEPNQRFCHNCGSAIPTTTEAPELIKEEEPLPSKTITQPTPTYTDTVSQYKPAGEGGAGPHSKKCLAFSLVSDGAVVVGLYLGLFTFIFSRIGGMFLGPDITRRLIALGVVAFVYALGLTFGILSKTNSGKAKYNEPENTVQKVGNVFGIIGIVASSIGMGAFLIAFLINIFIPL